jgi:flagellin
MATVNTNPGALIALQNLNRTNSELMNVQNRINTGMKVSTAKDNGAIFAISSQMRSDVRAYGVVANSLDRVTSTVDVALAASESIMDLLTEMKEKALAAADTSITDESRTAYNNDFVALRQQITQIVDNASFNGTNLLDDSTNAMAALANAEGGTMSVSAVSMSLGGSVLTFSAGADVSSASGASAMITALNTSIANLGGSLATLGTASKALTIHKNFVVKLSDATETGIGNLVDADLSRESARLQSLQVKQQLGIQALSIANNASSNVLSLFR